MTISCLSVTQKSRIKLFEKAVNSFSKQTFEASKRELIIVHHDGQEFTEQLKDLMITQRIDNFVISENRHLPLGELRNISVLAAGGDLLCQWDDDDIYHRERLRVQSYPFQDEGIIATTLGLQIFWFPNSREVYIRKGGKEGIHGSIMFKRDIQHTYPSMQKKGEDTTYICDLIKSYPVGIYRIDERPELYVRTVHGENTWPDNHHRNQIAQALDRSWLNQREASIRQWLKEFAIDDVNVCDASGIVFSIAR